MCFGLVLKLYASDLLAGLACDLMYISLDIFPIEQEMSKLINFLVYMQLTYYVE